MPKDEMYLEVGTLEGRTLEAAAHGNDGKTLYGVDPCEKYDMVPDGFGPNVTFVRARWQAFLSQPLAMPIGLAFYDGDHSADQTMAFMGLIKEHLADEAVLVLDDWDRESVRKGALETSYDCDERWQLLRECPEYTDGLTTASHHFGYAFGVAVFGFRR
jgi:hypothetical protein